LRLRARGRVLGGLCRGGRWGWPVSGGGLGIRLPSCSLSICWFETKTWKREDKLTSQTNTTHNKKKNTPTAFCAASVNRPKTRHKHAKKHTRQEILFFVVCALFVCVLWVCRSVFVLSSRGVPLGDLWGLNRDGLGVLVFSGQR